MSLSTRFRRDGQEGGLNQVDHAETTRFYESQWCGGGALGFRLVSKPGMWPSLGPLFGRNASLLRGSAAQFAKQGLLFLVWLFV